MPIQLTEENTKDATKWRARGDHLSQPVRIDRIAHGVHGWRVYGFTWNRGEESKGWNFGYPVNPDGTYSHNHDYDVIPVDDPAWKPRFKAGDRVSYNRDNRGGSKSFGRTAVVKLTPTREGESIPVTWDDAVGEGGAPENHFDLIILPDPPTKLFSVAAAMKLALGVRFNEDFFGDNKIGREAMLLRKWLAGNTGIGSVTKANLRIREQYPEFPSRSPVETARYQDEINKHGSAWFLAKWECYFGMRVLEFYKGKTT